MKFRITIASHPVPMRKDYEGTYTLHDSGVLEVWPEDGNRFLLSPAGWLEVNVFDD